MATPISIASRSPRWSCTSEMSRETPRSDGGACLFPGVGSAAESGNGGSWPDFHPPRRVRWILLTRRYEDLFHPIHADELHLRTFREQAGAPPLVRSEAHALFRVCQGLRPCFVPGRENPPVRVRPTRERPG